MPDHITLTRAMSRDDASALVGSDAPSLSPTLNGDVDGVICRDADTGAPLLAYLPMPRDRVAQLRAACLSLGHMGGVYRSAGGYASASAVFGSAPRKPQQAGREGCNRTSVSQTQPHVEAVLDDLAGHFAEVLETIDPELVTDARHVMEAVGQDWRINGDGLWTSGVINRNSQLPYHRDSLNWPTWSAMPVVRRGVRGGHLHLPEYDVVLPCRDGWAVYWCGYQLVHGVTPMQVRGDGYRYSVVYYALRGMKDCATYAEETRYARDRRTQRERGMADRLVTGEKTPGRLGMGGRHGSTFARFGR